MVDEETPRTTRWLLGRIATTLNVGPGYFFQMDQRTAGEAGPSAAQCEEAATLFRAIKSPTRRNAILNLLREMARDAR
jgi:hypothetical protein